MNHPSEGTVYKINLASFVAISNSKYSREINAPKVIFYQMSPRYGYTPPEAQHICVEKIYSTGKCYSYQNK